MDCHFEIYQDGAWRDCAVTTVPNPLAGGINGRSVFEYDIAYVFADKAEPVSLKYPVTADMLELPHWPAFLFDLIPQGQGRRFLLGDLKLADGQAADFALLRAGAFNPIGRLRIKEAVGYYQSHLARHPASEWQEGLSLAAILERNEQFIEHMMLHGMLGAGTTGIQGAAPKFLLTEDIGGLWFADGAMADRTPARHFIVKLPRGKSEADKKVLRNEAAYMRVAKALGLQVHATLEHENDMLFIPRFDREMVDGRLLCHHQESAASIAGVLGFDVRPSQFELLEAIRSVVSDKEGDTLEFLKRDVLNLAMRNTDNHARNTAVQVIGKTVRLSPLFDFAPMYLDPEMIPRVCRWYHPERGELTNWADVLKTLPVDAAEAAHLRRSLAQFGAQLEALPELMRQCGVDDDITTHLQNGIEEQYRQLAELAGPAN